MTLKFFTLIKRQRGWLSLLLLLIGQSVADDEAGQFATEFMLQQKEGSYCLTLDVRDDEFSSCVYQDQTSGGLCYPRNRAVLASCDEESDAQRWSYDYQKKQIYYHGYSSWMCLSRMVETVEMLPCSNEIQGQIWLFNEDAELASAADREFPQAYLKLLGRDEFDPRPLTFHFLAADMGEGECFKSPLTGIVECARSEETEADTGGETPDSPETNPNDSDQGGPAVDDSPPSPPVRPAVSWDNPYGLFWVSDKLTQDMELTYTVNNVCLEVEEPAACLKSNDYSRECYSGQRVRTATCLGQDNSLWKHDLKTKRIFNKAAGYSYCLSWLQNHFLLLPCFAGTSPAQKWFFGLGTYAAPLERGQLKSSSHGALKPFDYLKALDLPLSYGSASGVKSERSVHYESFGELCGYEPIEGKWTGDCTN